MLNMSISELHKYVVALAKQQDSQTKYDLVKKGVVKSSGAGYLVQLDGTTSNETVAATALFNKGYREEDYVFLLTAPAVIDGESKTEYFIFGYVQDTERDFINLNELERFQGIEHSKTDISLKNGIAKLNANDAFMIALAQHRSFSIYGLFTCTDEEGYSNYGVKVTLFNGNEKVKTYTFDTHNMQGQPFNCKELDQEKAFVLDDVKMEFDSAEVEFFAEGAASGSGKLAPAVSNLSLKAGTLYDIAHRLKVTIAADQEKDYLLKGNIEDTVSLVTTAYYQDTVISGTGIEYYFLSKTEEGKENNSTFKGYNILSDYETLTLANGGELERSSNPNNKFSVMNKDCSNYKNEFYCGIKFLNTIKISDKIIVYNFNKEKFTAMITTPSYTEENRFLWKDSDTIEVKCETLNENPYGSKYGDDYCTYTWKAKENGVEEILTNFTAASIWIKDDDKTDSITSYEMKNNQVEFSCTVDIYADKDKTEKITTETTDWLTITSFVAEMPEDRIAYKYYISNSPNIVFIKQNVYTEIEVEAGKSKPSNIIYYIKNEDGKYVQDKEEKFQENVIYYTAAWNGEWESEKENIEWMFTSPDEGPNGLDKIVNLDLEAGKYMYYTQQTRTYVKNIKKRETTWNEPLMFRGVDSNGNILTSEEIAKMNTFNSLTKGGVLQGLKTDPTGDVYLNATYINTGVLSVSDDNGNTLFRADIDSQNSENQSYVQIAGFDVDQNSISHNKGDSNQVYLGTDGLCIGDALVATIGEDGKASVSITGSLEISGTASEEGGSNKTLIDVIDEVDAISNRRLWIVYSASDSKPNSKPEEGRSYPSSDSQSATSTNPRWHTTFTDGDRWQSQRVANSLNEALNDAQDNGWSEITMAAGRDGQSDYSIHIQNDYITIPVNSDGSVNKDLWNNEKIRTSIYEVYRGLEKISSSSYLSFRPTGSNQYKYYISIISTIHIGYTHDKNTGTIIVSPEADRSSTFTVLFKEVVDDNQANDITLASVDINVVKQVNGVQGEPGTYIYIVAEAATYKDASKRILIEAKQSSGDGTVTAYEGWWKATGVEGVYTEKTRGSNDWELQSGNVTGPLSAIYIQPKEDAEEIKIELYGDENCETLLDRENITRVHDGDVESVVALDKIEKYYTIHTSKTTAPDPYSEENKDKWGKEEEIFFEWQGRDDTWDDKTYIWYTEVRIYSDGSKKTWETPLLMEEYECISKASFWQIRDDVYVKDYRDTDSKTGKYKFPVLTLNESESSFGPVTGNLNKQFLNITTECEAGDVGRWCLLYERTAINGGAIMTGTVTAEQLQANNLSGLFADLGTIYAGKIQTESYQTFVEDATLTDAIYTEETTNSRTAYSFISEEIPNPFGYKYQVTFNRSQPNTKKIHCPFGYKCIGIEITSFTGTISTGSTVVPLYQTKDSASLEFVPGVTIMLSKPADTLSSAPVESFSGFVADLPSRFLTNMCSLTYRLIMKPISSIEGACISFEEENKPFIAFPNFQINSEGSINAKKGTIGGFELGDNYLQSTKGEGKISLYDTGRIVGTSSDQSKIELSSDGMFVQDADQNDLYQLSATGLYFSTYGGGLSFGDYFKCFGDSYGGYISATGPLVISGAQDQTQIKLNSADLTQEVVTIDYQVQVIYKATSGIVGTQRRDLWIQVISSNTLVNSIQMPVSVTHDYFLTGSGSITSDAKKQSSIIPWAAGQSKSDKYHCVLTSAGEGGGMNCYVQIEITIDGTRRKFTFSSKGLEKDKEHTVVNEGGFSFKQLKYNNDMLIKGNLVPTSKLTYKLGSSESYWKEAYIDKSIFSGQTRFNADVYHYGNIYHNNSIIHNSDANVKNTIELIENDVRYEKLFDNLRPVSYKFNAGTSGRTHTGLIAQELKQNLLDAGFTTQEVAAYCEWENTSQQWDATCGIRYEELIALNICEIQRLKKQIAQQDNRIKELEEKIKEN